MIKLVPLGDTGLTVSRLCFGALTVSPVQANLAVEAGAGVIAAAIKAGVNFIDTAQLYGAYPYIKRAMELSGRRDIIIATKTYAHTRQLAERALDEARLGLGRDYIDIFLLHEQESVHTLNGHGEALDYLYKMKQKGVVKAVGASMHHVAAVYGAIEKRLDVIHPIINIAGLGIVDGSREDMEKAVRDARAQGIGVYGMKALGGGNLFKRAQSCLEYALGLDFVDSIAIGMQSAEEVAANVRFFKTGRFGYKEAAALSDKTRRLHIDDWCEGCGQCAEHCGQAALTLAKGRASCDHSRCVLCGYCSRYCPMWAIKIV